jgi:DNA-directed RNA polymerase subunit RPC12/RpoP
METRKGHEGGRCGHRNKSRRFGMRCKYCGGEARDYEPEVRKVVDYVPYGDRNVPMVSYEGSEATYLCDDCGRELYDDEVVEEDADA